ncbi:MAG: T9SS type A sorting domain-containing protein [Bacteroidetes bacterium]|nr:T9SS type A sorting domain-containing protein [Bacteroidota bacterium]
MKKIFTLVVLLLVSGILLSQVKQRNDGNLLSAVRVIKEINNMPPVNAKSIIDSLHYDGDQYDAIGTGAAADISVYAFFPASVLTAHNTLGNHISSVKIYINGIADVTSAELRFYSDQGTTLVRSQAFVPIEGWNNVVLTTPLAIPATNLYIGYRIVTTGGYPAGCDAGPVNTNANWIVYGGTWQHLTDLSSSLTYNWNIRAMVDGAAITSPIASCNQSAWAAGSYVPTSTSVNSGTFTLTNIGGGTLTSGGITGLSSPFTTTFVPASVSLAAGASTTFTFTYNPTVAGTTNQTVVINTNGGNISLSLSGTAITCNAISSYPFTEGFETAVPPPCWTSIDADGDGNNWMQLSEVSVHGGTNAAISASYNGTALTPDNYLITPRFNINNSQLVFKYWVATEAYDYPAENYSIMVSTTGTAPANFTEVFSETLTVADTAWSERTIPLSTYNGNIYIAFRHHDVTDMVLMKIDDVSLDMGTSINENQFENNINVFPNPVKESLNIVSNEKVISVNIMNIMGQLVESEMPNSAVFTVNTSNLETGVYFVKLQTAKGIILKKFNKSE